MEKQLMAKDNSLILFQQTLNATGLLVSVFLGLFIAWFLIYLQESKSRKRPGINFKEL